MSIKKEAILLIRLTYKSNWGDYGSSVVFDSEWDEKCALRNALGKYEDLGYSPEELKDLLDSHIRNDGSNRATAK